MEDPYDAREEQPVTPPETGQNIPGQNKARWDGGVVRIFFSRKTVIDPEQKDVTFETHLGQLNVKAKFKLSSMKYHGKIEL